MNEYYNEELINRLQNPGESDRIKDALDATHSIIAASVVGLLATISLYFNYDVAPRKTASDHSLLRSISKLTTEA